MNPHCRVYQASTKLMRALPQESWAPAHCVKVCDGEEIMLHQKQNVTVLTCVTTYWHYDWEQIFCLVVIKGKGRLHISRLADKDKDDNPIWDNNPPGKTEVFHLRRGTIIQFWGMAFHRVTCRGEMAMISYDSNNEPVFDSQRKLEAQFLSYCRTQRASA